MENYTIEDLKEALDENQRLNKEKENIELCVDSLSGLCGNIKRSNEEFTRLFKAQNQIYENLKQSNKDLDHKLNDLMNSI